MGTRSTRRELAEEIAMAYVERAELVMRIASLKGVTLDEGSAAWGFASGILAMADDLESMSDPKTYQVALTRNLLTEAFCELFDFLANCQRGPYPDLVTLQRRGTELMAKLPEDRTSDLFKLGGALALNSARLCNVILDVIHENFSAKQLGVLVQTSTALVRTRKDLHTSEIRRACAWIESSSWSNTIGSPNL